MAKNFQIGKTYRMYDNYFLGFDEGNYEVTVKEIVNRYGYKGVVVVDCYGDEFEVKVEARRNGTEFIAIDKIEEYDCITVIFADDEVEEE